MRKKSVCLRFFAPFSGVAQNGKQGKCGHTCHFRRDEALRKCLLGSLPKPGTFGTKCPKGQAAEPALSGLFLIGASAGEVEKMVNVALRRDDLPHFILSGTVLRGEGLFLFG